MVSAFVFTFDNMTPESDIVYSVKYKENDVKTYSFRSPETDQWYDYVADGVPGAGTKDDPYKISTPQQFAYFARYAPSDNYIDKYVVLTNDIDMGAKYWTPFTFKGNFDGQNYSLINLKINDTKGSYFNGGSGLFSSIPMSSSSWSGYHVSYISNLHFVNPDVKGTSCTGILAGKICDTFVENCTVTGGKVSTLDTNTHAGGLVEVVDAYRWVFEEQNRETGAAGKLSYGDAGAHYMPSFITAMEMYFQRQPWGNETAGTKLDRDGAIEYTFAQLVDHECGGKTYGTLKKTYTREDFNDLLAQSEFVILMARLSDDPVYGEQAKEAMSDVLKTMEYLYEETTVLNKYVETFGFYTSALFAAADATDSYFEKTAYLDMAQKVITGKIMPSVAADGGYSKEVGKQDISGDPYATAAVAMALGDYTKEKSYLSTFVYELSDASAVSQDLAAIDLGTLIVGDLDLPTKGVYGSTFTWESSDNNIIDAKTGKVVRSATDQPVTLTVTAVKGDETASRIISVTVKANADGNTDNVDAVLSGLQIPFMAISDIEMPGSSIEGVSLTWASSNPDALTAEGKVTRPAIGAEDATVTLTVTVSQGDVTKTKDFPVTVYAQTNDSLKEGYYLTQSKYLKNRAINGYWAIYAAYAVLGDYIADPANGYTFILSSPQANWYGVQYGATVMALCAMGENPYNYNGENWVQKLYDNYGGPYAGGLYSAFGMEAAGANSTLYTPAGDYQVGQLSEKSMIYGIDISGWASVLVAKHHDFPSYEESNAAALKAWLNYLKGLGIDSDGNFVGCNDISTGCAITGFAALYSIGMTDVDPALDTWKNAATGKGIIDAIYEQGLVEDRIPGYMTQMEMAICDMYNAKYNGSTSTAKTGTYLIPKAAPPERKLPRCSIVS